MNLNSYLLLLIKDIPKFALAQVVKDKLHDCGIDDDEQLATAIAEHLLSGSNEKFQWDNDEYSNVTLTFTDKDFDKIERFVDSKLKETLPSAIQEAVNKGAEILIERLTTDWPEQIIYERNELQAFRERLNLRWCKGLDPLRMLLTCSREICGKFTNALLRSKAKKGIVRRKVLILLHMRACQTTMEIITLLENGLADGALARWRTLYELGVVARLIYIYGDDIAQRYLDHDEVAMKQSMDNELKFYNSASRSPISKKEQKEINGNFDAVITRYGKEFGSNYGWASHHLRIKKPTFQQLEIAATREFLPPTYKWASFKIHAGVAGLLRNLGNITEELVTLAGASNAGLEEPAVYTAYTLTEITSLLYGNSKKLENMIELTALCNLRDQVMKECTKAARKLEIDERQLSEDFLENKC